MAGEKHGRWRIGGLFQLFPLAASDRDNDIAHIDAGEDDLFSEETAEQTE